MGSIQQRLLAALSFILAASLQTYGQAVITTDTVIPTSTCPGGYLLIPFEVDGMSPGPNNRFYAEWSDAFGNFDSPDTVGSIPFIFGSNGLIPGQIPEDATFGINYRIRVVSSNPQVVGTTGPTPIFVTSVPFMANIFALPLDEQCEGDPVTLVAGVGFGGSYKWSTGDTAGTVEVTEPGTYSVTVSFLGCEEESEPYTLTMLPQPPRPTIQHDPAGELWSTPGDGYQWYLDGVEIPGAESMSHAPQATGEYSVAVIDENGCRSAPSGPVFHVQTGGSLTGSPPAPAPRDTITSWIEYEFPEAPGPPAPAPWPDLRVLVYPVPTSDLLTVETNTLETEKIFFVLYDAAGRVMYTSPRRDILGYYRAQVDMTAMPKGMYNLQLFVRGSVRSYNVMKVD